MITKVIQWLLFQDKTHGSVRTDPLEKLIIYCHCLCIKVCHIWCKTQQLLCLTRDAMSSCNVTISSYTSLQTQYNQLCHPMNCSMTKHLPLLPPYGIEQAIIFLPCGFFLLLSILCNRETIYIFILWFLSFFLLSFFSSPISAATDWISTILLHMAWP